MVASARSGAVSFTLLQRKLPIRGVVHAGPIKRALEKVGDPRAQEALQTLEWHPNRKVRREAKGALKNLQGRWILDWARSRRLRCQEVAQAPSRSARAPRAYSPVTSRPCESCESRSAPGSGWQRGQTTSKRSAVVSTRPSKQTTRTSTQPRHCSRLVRVDIPVQQFAAPHRVLPAHLRCQRPTLAFPPVLGYTP